ncbi:hypothetical protein [Phytohabitans rumicis]|uniref:DUF3800 domain-containing protein n=1 Tax=Phytohabitans rumicis TaxID=1076125 RepID=A0A6V8KWZ6_9ACTN|nr:hypothetical protein [Phytohabitans rumicis]GFJ86366.1 hypothetical protein Prum_000080 [Phytohabitans rumicis]
MKLYMDESGNGQQSQPLIVGAVETGEDSEEIERRIQDLHRRVSARRSLSGLRSFDAFRKHGFHASTDPPEVSNLFLELMQDLSFKAYVLVTDGTSVLAGSTEIDRLKFMYTSLLGDLLIRHRAEPELLCYIEQNDGMKQLVRNLPDSATRRAHEKLGRPTSLPRLNVVMVPKTEAMSMAIIDYVMIAVSRWIRSNYTTKPEDWSYRAFRIVEPFISILYSLERGLISSRKMPLH